MVTITPNMLPSSALPTTMVEIPLLAKTPSSRRDTQLSEVKRNREVRIQSADSTSRHLIFPGYRPQRKFANPAPLGLLAFALTTFVLSIINVGRWCLAKRVIARQIALGEVIILMLDRRSWTLQAKHRRWTCDRIRRSDPAVGRMRYAFSLVLHRLTSLGNGN